MSFSFKDRHLYGAGAAACAVCCAAPILTVLGIAGAGATVATFLFAGVVFAGVVAAGALVAYGAQRRRGRTVGCDPVPCGPVDLELTIGNTDQAIVSGPSER